MKLQQLFYCLAVLISFYTNAQNNTRFTAYTVNSGLPQSSIDEICQDKNGFLWVGTAGGLCRFDGYQFKVYKHSKNDAHSINSDRGFHFYNDQNKQLWLVSYHGVSIYDASKDQFNNLLTYEPSKVVTSENHIYGEDEQFIWFGLNEYGLIKIDKITHQIQKQIIPGLNQQANHFSWYRGFKEKNKLWILTKSAFLIYNTENKTAQNIPLQFTCLANMNDSMAIGIQGNIASLINKKNWSIKTVSIVPKGFEANIKSLLKLNETTILLCSTTKGLFYLDISTGSITKRIDNFEENHASLASANCAFVDASQNLWIGTLNDGLRMLPFTHKGFKLYRSDSSKSNMINSIYADATKLYVGSSGNGIDIFSRKKGFEKNIAVNKNIPNVLNTAVIVNAIPNEQLFLIAYSNKEKGNHVPFSLFINNHAVKTWNKAVLDTIKKYWGQGNFRNFLFKLSDSTFLINAGEYLLTLKQSSNKQFSISVLQHFPNETLSCCFRDIDGNIFLGTYKQLYVYQKKQWRKISLPNTLEIKTITQDPDKNIWVGNSNGIYVLNSSFQVIQNYTEDNQLLNEHLYGMLSDNKGDIWFSHNKGISVFRWKKKIFQHYGKDDGLQSDEFNASAYFKAADGELFFGGINGTTGFYPDDIRFNPHIPPVKITSIKLFDEPLKADQSYWDITSLQLPYTSNSLSFDFAMPEYSNPSKSRYAYFLEGIDKSWIDAGTKRFARYPALAPGNYTFKVKAANDDGIWNETPTSISIAIIPPIWQQTWFFIVSTILIIWLIILVVSFIQKQRFKKKMQVVELQFKIQLERERISRDLHDNVGTQLSLINKRIQGIIHTAGESTQEETLQKMALASENSMEVMGALRETIWALNKEEISIQEFFDKLKAFAQKLAGSDSTTALHFIEKEENAHLVLGPAEVLNLFRICQEAISNAFKYANATILEIELSVTNNIYAISIADNGIGFNPENIDTHQHYGLENMKFRANEIKCLLTIQSNHLKGTCILIQKL
jgi:signal transduction histidine kinase/ligand-binding sensor domain-containing protein